MGFDLANKKRVASNKSGFSFFLFLFPFSVDHYHTLIREVSSHLLESILIINKPLSMVNPSFRTSFVSRLITFCPHEEIPMQWYHLLWYGIWTTQSGIGFLPYSNLPSLSPLLNYLSSTVSWRFSKYITQVTLLTLFVSETGSVEGRSPWCHTLNLVVYCSYNQLRLDIQSRQVSRCETHYTPQPNNQANDEEVFLSIFT